MCWMMSVFCVTRKLEGFQGETLSGVDQQRGWTLEKRAGTQGTETALRELAAWKTKCSVTWLQGEYTDTSNMERDEVKLCICPNNDNILYYVSMSH